MSIFPRLPLLDGVFPGSRRLPLLQDVALVCVQHLLITTGSLLEKFIELGFLPENIHVLGKLYSTDSIVPQRLRTLGIRVYDSGTSFEWGNYSQQISSDISSMWNQAIAAGAFESIRKIVVLDDGGGNIAGVPQSLVGSFSVVGVEQTMSGITLNRSERPKIPFIAVGSSAAKVLIEPRIIQEELICRVKSKINLGKGTSGVVGNGYIGQAVCDGLRAAGADVFVYEKDHSRRFDDGYSNCETLEELYSVSDTIWGCTGSDHIAGHSWLKLLEKNKILISCSSKDSEFRSALERINEQPEDKYTSRLSDVNLMTNSGVTRILAGGFPINFTGTSESESAEDIQFTRALLLSGVLQGVDFDDKLEAGADVELDPYSQIEIVARWLELYPDRRSRYSESICEVFTSEENVHRNGSRLQLSSLANETQSLHR